MIYLADITTPANTAASAPLVTRLKITKGLIYKIRIYAPYGAMGLHYGQIFDGKYQVWPTTPGTAFRGDGYEIDFDDLYIKEAAPYELTIKTWNFDDAFEHLYMIYIGLVSKQEYMARFLPGTSVDEMNKMIANILLEQESIRKQILSNAFNFNL